MESPLAPEVLETAELPTHADVSSAGGATGRMWRVRAAGETVGLRRAPSPESARRQVEAARIARAGGVPVPEVLRHVSDAEHGELLVVEWAYGEPMVDVCRRAPEHAAAVGALLRATQERLNQVVAPAWFPAAASWRGAERLDVDGGSRPFAVPAGDALLHLDLHADNVLVATDEMEPRISAVLDWDNAMRGHPRLESARIWALCHLDPALFELPSADREILAAWYAGWVDGDADRGDPVARLWAARSMYADLAGRYADRPHRLRALRAAVGEQEAIVFGGSAG